MTIETLSRTLYERLRLAAVASGCLPDVLIHTTPVAFAAAKAAIRLTGVQIVEVKGEGAPDQKDEKTVTTISLQRRGSSPGGLGGWPVMQHVATGANFKKVQLPDKTRNVLYEVRSVSNSARYDRIADQIIVDALGQRKYLQAVLPNHSFDPTEGFLLMKSGESDVTSTDIIERIYTFSAVDVWLEEPTLIAEGVVQMAQINGTPIVADNPGTAPNEALTTPDVNLFLAGDNPVNLTVNATEVP
ncbi:hypothetical protein UFOVP1492_113 [uncultured Caudovirales phage]|uniref:Uncharacterized protein n=1 Tax=uncultured Caudovirales phage TaxID=2100421 RepID=A0A6J5QVY2_9CAUD|nr:hypothetical protein UFOVP1127_21 [uncultured Caudovirales phage]CAB4193282.1 hypothetical protein UFOVP1242_53 [uncultured Caudovirales phage]CAB4217873.1 hypothetical protein UFOVP1492_113 [uncultured Caudovirales phage]CAB5230962.1 hypothetical protein UFOVP1580_6 [uncultured Caudovirales phage]